MNVGGYDLQFFPGPAATSSLSIREPLGKALEFYGKKFGEDGFRQKAYRRSDRRRKPRLYSSQGMLFIADRQFEQARDITNERIQREAAYQWWGQTVGLKSSMTRGFAGTCPYIAYALRENTLTGAQLDNLRRDCARNPLRSNRQRRCSRSGESGRPVDRLSVHHVRKGCLRLQASSRHPREQKFNQLFGPIFRSNRGKNASIDDFEKLTSRVAGDNLRTFLHDG